MIRLWHDQGTEERLIKKNQGTLGTTAEEVIKANNETSANVGYIKGEKDHDVKLSDFFNLKLAMYPLNNHKT